MRTDSCEHTEFREDHDAATAATTAPADGAAPADCGELLFDQGLPVVALTSRATSLERWW